MYEFYIFICCEVNYSKIISLTPGHAAASSSPVSLPFKIFFNNMIKEIFFCRTHALFSTVGRWCSLNCWVNILSSPCSSIACLGPSLFHAVQTSSQRQNKFPHDNFCSSYYSNKVKCYQTGIMLKISAKKPATTKAKNQKTASQNFSSCATHYLACSQQIQLLLLLSCLFLFAQILIHYSSLDLLEESPHILLSAQHLQGEPEMAVCSLEELQYLGGSKKCS